MEESRSRPVGVGREIAKIALIDARIRDPREVATRTVGIARPLWVFVRRRATLEEDHSGLDPEFRLGEPVRSSEDRWEALAAFFIRRDGFDLHLGGRQ